MMATDTDPSPAVCLNRVTTHAGRLIDALQGLDDAGGFPAAAATSHGAAHRCADLLKLVIAEAAEAREAFGPPAKPEPVSGPVG
jgi:hypothetical protein